MVVLLVGPSTRHLYRFVRWELDVALELDLSIVAVNLNGKRFMEPTGALRSFVPSMLSMCHSSEPSSSTRLKTSRASTVYGFLVHLGRCPTPTVSTDRKSVV